MLVIAFAASFPVVCVFDPFGRMFSIHAYNVRDGSYVGCESFLDEVTCSSDACPKVNGGRGQNSARNPQEPAAEDTFNLQIFTLLSTPIANV